MARQKILILTLSIIGLIAVFLPWIKGLLIGTVTVVGISGRGEKEVLWLVMGLFLTPVVICLINKRKYLTRWILFWSIFPAFLAAVIAFMFFLIDLNSPRMDIFVGINNASDLNLKLGPAPYVVFIVGTLITLLGFGLKPKNTGALLTKDTNTMRYLILTVEPHGDGNHYCFGMDQHSFNTIIPQLNNQQIYVVFNNEEIPIERLSFFNNRRLTETRINQWIVEREYHVYPQRNPTKLIFKIVGNTFIYYTHQAYWPLHI